MHTIGDVCYFDTTSTTKIRKAVVFFDGRFHVRLCRERDRCKHGAPFNACSAAHHLAWRAVLFGKAFTNYCDSDTACGDLQLGSSTFAYRGAVGDPPRLRSASR